MIERRQGAGFPNEIDVGLCGRDHAVLEGRLQCLPHSECIDVDRLLLVARGDFFPVDQQEAVLRAKDRV